MEANERGILNNKLGQISVPISAELWERIQVPGKDQKKRTTYWWSIAAGFSLLLLAGFWMINNLGKDHNSDIALEQTVEEMPTGFGDETSLKNSSSEIKSPLVKQRDYTLNPIEKRAARPFPEFASLRNWEENPSHSLEVIKLENAGEKLDNEGVAVRIQLVFTDPFPDQEKSGLGKKINKFNKKLKKDLDLEKVKTKAKKMFVSNGKKKEKDEQPDIN